MADADTNGDSQAARLSPEALDARLAAIERQLGLSGKEGTTSETPVKEFLPFEVEMERKLAAMQVQHDMQGRPQFFHRNLQKWRTGFRPKHINIKPDDAGRQRPSPIGGGYRSSQNTH